MTTIYKAEPCKPFRVVIIGQTLSGKSQVVDRFVKAEYTEPHQTVGAEFHSKCLALDSGVKIEFNILDLAGHEIYRAMAPMYYRGAHAAIVVYDITDIQSYEGSKSWVRHLREYAANNDIIIALVGSKADLAEHRAIYSKDAKAYADRENLLFAEVSAKTGNGVQEMFESLAVRYLSDDHIEARNHQKSAPMKQKVLEPRLPHSVSSSTTFFCPSL